jgi:hypothetical protein
MHCLVQDWDYSMNENLLATRRCFLKRLPLLAAPVLLSSGPAWADVVEETGRFNVRKFGAKGDGVGKDTRAVQAAIDAAGKEGGCVYFPPGRYLCGTVRLCSRISLYLESGAVLTASQERSDFDEYEKLSYNSYSDDETTDFNYALIRGRELERVAILGPGMIDMARTKRHGPKPIAFKLCRDILIRDVTIENSPNYNISLLGCDYVDILGVTIRKGYCDGIDPDSCRYVRIANCYIQSWDDAIVPKASPSLGYLRTTEHVTVTNCVLTTGCNGLKLGTEASGGFKDIVFSNCTIYSDLERWPGHPATSGLSIESVDGGPLERVAVSNLVMNGVQAPLFVRLGNRGRGQREPQPKFLRDISISEIVATGAELTSSITGIPGYSVSGVTLKNIRITAAGGGKPDLANQAVPEMEKEYPDADMFKELPAYGLYCRHVDSLLLDGLQLGFEKADSRPAMILDDVTNVDLRNVLAKPPAGSMPTIEFKNVRETLVQGCRALEGTGTWARVSGARSAHVRLSGNDLSRTAKPVESAPDLNTGALQCDG